jgi:hypothetical protein
VGVFDGGVTEVVAEEAWVAIQRNEDLNAGLDAVKRREVVRRAAMVEE